MRVRQPLALEFTPRLRALRLLEDVTTNTPVERVADNAALTVKGLLAVFGDLAARRRDSPRQAALLRALAAGRTLSEAAANDGLSDGDAAAQLSPTDALVDAVTSVITTRSALPTPLLASPRGPLQTFPVRLPEAQYRRLKSWSDENGFPMAAIVRGLLERFLDGQRAPDPG